jgi:hypothetical protein
VCPQLFQVVLPRRKGSQQKAYWSIVAIEKQAGAIMFCYYSGKQINYRSLYGLCNHRVPKAPKNIVKSHTNINFASNAERKDEQSHPMLGLQIDPKYIKVEGTLFKREIVNFPKFFWDLLFSIKVDGEDIRGGVVAAKNYDSGQEFEEDPGLISQIPGPSIGFRFNEVFLFEKFAPFHMLVVKTGKSSTDYPFALASFIIPELKESFGHVIFKNKYSGVFGTGKRISMKIKGDKEKAPGLKQILADKELLDVIDKLLDPNGASCGMSFYKNLFGDDRSGEIWFRDLKHPFFWRGGNQPKFGMIEIGFSTELKTIKEYQIDYAKLWLKAFSVAARMGQYVRWGTTDPEKIGYILTSKYGPSSAKD